MKSNVSEPSGGGGGSSGGGGAARLLDQRCRVPARILLPAASIKLSQLSTRLAFHSF